MTVRIDQIICHDVYLLGMEVAHSYSAFCSVFGNSMYRLAFLSLHGYIYLLTPEAIAIESYYLMYGVSWDQGTIAACKAANIYAPG